MKMTLQDVLRQWRDNQARMEGVEGFRVLPNATLFSLAEKKPQTKNDLLSIKGIKEGKCRKYGAALLRIIEEQTIEKETGEEFFQEGAEKSSRGESDILSVGQFLDGVNAELSGMAARIRGEVSSVDERERVVYFTLKDEEGTLSCLIFQYQYRISGVMLKIGDEVIVEGVPEVYKPNGRLSLRVGVIELCGEGALQKAYDALKLKLEQEGVFSPERKRLLPELPQRIALITSEQGAAIGDFTTNLGRHGLTVHFCPTSVEGKRATVEIIEAIRFFQRQKESYDILVLVRGGGSLESLQAFNNEMLVREIASSKIPTLLGVGHEKDITLAALAADTMVSTPTAAARTLSFSWEKASGLLRQMEQHIFQAYEKAFLVTKYRLRQYAQNLSEQLDVYIKVQSGFRERLFLCFSKIEYALREQRQKSIFFQETLLRRFAVALETIGQSCKHTEEALHRYDPKRALRLGYSLIKKEGQLVRSVRAVRAGDMLSVRLADGRLDSQVLNVYNEEAETETL
ncbi:MAG: exodeoxyribonuclease VII large subunit [Candidatus Moranbacteria bacterium]|nr:exodeoxyribonuclease VII large subunit [Candidatus Moranbacteria bacterium]